MLVEAAFNDMAGDQFATARFDTLLMKKLPPTPPTKKRYDVMPIKLPTPRSGMRPHFRSASPDSTASDDDRSPTLVPYDTSPTDTDWSHKRDSAFPSPKPDDTALFDDVREQFQGGISTLDNLLRYMEHSGPAQCKGYRRGILTLLANLVAMAKWLVAFLELARTTDNDSIWTRGAVLGLRVDLHQYSWKVMKLTTLLKQVGAYHAPKLQLR